MGTPQICFDEIYAARTFDILVLLISLKNDKISSDLVLLLLEIF